MTLKQYQVNLIPYFSRYRVTEKASPYDMISEHPGQIVKDVVENSNGELPLSTVGFVSETDLTKVEKKMVLYEDALEEIDKKALAYGIENKMDIYGEPKDLQIVKNIFGEDFDPSKLDQIR